MKPINELDMAALRLEFRNLYKEIGFEGMLQVIYEITTSAEAACEVTLEERMKEHGQK